MNGGAEAFGFGRAGDTPRVACEGLDGLGAAGPRLHDVRQDHRQLK
jgi:hypothetical protein